MSDPNTAEDPRLKVIMLALIDCGEGVACDDDPEWHRNDAVTILNALNAHERSVTDGT